MDRRSTNVKGFVHYGGEIRSGVEHGIGFNVGTASTGSTCWLETISDDTNAHLGIRAQGAGTITIGNSSNPVTIGGGAAFKGAYSTTFAYAYAALSSGQFADLSIASTTADIMPGDLFSVELATTTNALAVLALRTSTEATSRVTVVVGNIGSTAFGSTGSGTGRLTWIDLT